VASAVIEEAACLVLAAELGDTGEMFSTHLFCAAAACQDDEASVSSTYILSSV
jgi:hypothetical protein